MSKPCCVIFPDASRFFPPRTMFYFSNEPPPGREFELVDMKSMKYERMPVVAMTARMFSEEKLKQLHSFPGIRRDDLIRFFTLTQVDVAFVDTGVARARLTGLAWPFNSKRCHGWGSCPMRTSTRC